jgi:hypothetical protein
MFEDWTGCGFAEQGMAPWDELEKVLTVIREAGLWKSMKLNEFVSFLVLLTIL